MLQLSNAARHLLPLICLALPTNALAQESPGESAASREAAVRPASSPDHAWQPVKQGRLGNGLRYAILPRRGNEPGVALRVRVKGGFIAERRPGERGLAHLIEHLVFHSPTRSAPDRLRRFREVGFPLSIPEPAGGTTTWRESDYFLLSRTTRPADLDTLLGLFREVFSDLTFRTDAVDGQRAEVMREMADKKLGNDVYAGYIAAVAPGSPTDVIDAQNSDDVPTASVETIRRLYHRLYRPENVTVVIVGDVDASQVAALVEKRFGDWQAMGPAPASVAVPSFRRDRIAPLSFSSLRYGRNGAMIAVAAPLPPPPPSRSGQARSALMDMLAVRTVNARLAQTRADYPPGKYGFFIENGEQGHRLLMLWDDFVPGRWQPAIASLARTTCDLRRAGFSEPEWTAAKRQLLEELEGRAKTMGEAPNFELARDLSNVLTDGRELVPPDELLLAARTLLPTLSVQEGAEWWRHQWSAGVEHRRVESPELVRLVDPKATIGSVVDQADRAAGCPVQPG